MSLTGHRVFALVAHKHFALCPPPRKQLTTLTHYLTLPPDRITSTTKATPLPTTRNVNIVATNIKHGG